MVNDHTAFRVDWMPFAGLRESGHGIGGIPYTFRDMQVEKLTVIRSAEISCSTTSWLTGCPVESTCSLIVAHVRGLAESLITGMIGWPMIFP